MAEKITCDGNMQQLTLRICLASSAIHPITHATMAEYIDEWSALGENILRTG